MEWKTKAKMNSIRYVFLLLLYWIKEHTQIADDALKNKIKTKLWLSTRRVYAIQTERVL